MSTMRLLENWQYKYIEKSLFGYKQLQESNLESEKKILLAINSSLEYFKDTPHETMMREFYFNRHKFVNRFTVTGYFRYVCQELICTEEPNGYVIRREIIYKIAMMCFELHLFKSKSLKIPQN